ncbi:uncharacterized protein SOCE836_054660 [Sorangium cellulosum]|uniref:Uncharacterized protein n=1 Tax=Sorangium cellulosum TaxID=56 RepID=A0A4P2QT72_SORCE|nr:uncharacterized protein SOCE836_054630 [Sorangium cellulosum]AUX33311.1 uncharacterized protein SOCE836_054660 [Sorangium cellulosum]
MARAVRLYELIDRTGLMRSDRPSTRETPAITATSHQAEGILPYSCTLLAPSGRHPTV